MASTVVQLSVGGVLYTTTADTLSSPLAKGSMLETLAALHTQRQPSHAESLLHVDSDRMQPTLTDPRHPDSLFIDRNGSLFGSILDYLRDGGQLVGPEDLSTTRRLMREAEYYQLQGLVQLLRQHETGLIKQAEDAKGLLQVADAVLTKAFKATNLLEEVAEKLDKLKLLDSLDDTLNELRKYLAPKMLYHTGKRGGPNYHRPRNLLEDLEGILEALADQRS